MFLISAVALSRKKTPISQPFDSYASLISGIKYVQIILLRYEDFDGNINAEIILVVKLKNTINYELGDGSKFNPYVVSE